MEAFENSKLALEAFDNTQILRDNMWNAINMGQSFRRRKVIMGGNALKNYETTRLNKADYLTILSKFTQKFRHAFGFVPMEIPAYKNKETYGDLDVLVVSENLPSDWIDTLITEFNLADNMIHKNGNVVSIGYLNFQIDLIVTPQEDLITSYFYFAYNDLGNLIGRIGHKMGVKISHKGLYIVLRHDDHILGEILLSKNPEDVFDLLGLDPQKYGTYGGFDELEDIFKFVASSKYFDPEIYSLEHRSHTSRIRDKKRTTYNKFLRWVEETKPEAKHSFADKSERGGYNIRHPYYETEVLSRWPWVESEVNRLISDYEFDQRFKTVYNGNIVSELTGYSGKTLGAFMSIIKPYLSQERKESWIADPRIVRHFVTQRWIDCGGVQFNVEK